MGSESEICPHCGAICAQTATAILKTSTILISANQTDAVYRSVDDVPEPLRKMLLQCTNGLNSGTILIADRRGKDQISKAIQSLPSSTQRKLRETALGGRFQGLPPRRFLGWPLRYWAGLLTVGATGLLAWMVTSYRW
ncbi:MAG: hypothetical protein M3Y07_03030 [Acidobacteriota bacterium]|nr:hypothetical protein [Acidobacteriota bacterium]